MITVGQKVQCKPYAGTRILGMGIVDEIAVGVVVYVNEDHRWFTVEYDTEHHFRVSFNFNDIDNLVWKI